jgi:contact-dependent growth inhibition (CDI) system CdiI-like immunity protein
MDIKIKITSKRPRKIHNVKAYEGFIHIGDFSESIYVPLDYWSRADYERQWKEGLERIKIHDTSCLVATIHDPKIRKFVDWWELYKINNVIYVQNGWLIEHLYDEIVGDNQFTPDTCYNFITPRVAASEGHTVSEWSVPFKPE